MYSSRQELSSFIGEGARGKPKKWYSKAPKAYKSQKSWLIAIDISALNTNCQTSRLKI